MGVPVLLAEGLKFVSVVSVLEERPKVKAELTDELVRGENVFVHSLNCDLVVCLRLLGLDFYEVSPVEARFSRLAPPVSVS